MPASTHFQMRSGNPHISEADIQQLLTGWVTSANNQRHIGLESLILVDEFITRPENPEAEKSRQFALDRLICFIIEDELLYQRSALNLADKLPKNILEAEAHIRNDVQSNSKLLIGWSILYHCYARRDLNISFDYFGELVGVVERSLRRYRVQAIHELTNTLIHRERLAREQHKKLFLSSELPATVKRMKLFGRERFLDHAYKVIHENFASTILISGGVGVGKTAFVVHIMESMISELALDYLIWISSPKQIDDIYQTIAYKLKLNEHHLLKDWLSLYRVVIVIDNAHQIAGNIDTLSTTLSHTLLFLISPQQIQSRNIDSVIVLDELQKNDAYKFIDYASRYAVYPVDVFDVDDIYRQAGGNPSAILLHMQNIAYDWSYQQGFNELFDVIYDDLADLSRDLWILMAVMGSGCVKINHFSSIFTMFSSDNWQDLFRHYLCFRSNNDESVALHSVAYTYIEAKAYSSNIWKQYLDNITQNLINAPEYSLEILNNLLGNRLISSEDDLHYDCVAQLMNFREELGISWAWMNYFDFIQISTPEVQLAKARVYRRRQQWSQAMMEIDNLKLDQDHPLYVEHQLEEAILNRYQGNHQKTLQTLNYIHRLQSTKLIKNEIYFEYSRMYLDLRDGEMARQYLLKISPLENQKRQHQLLYINALMQMNKTSDSIKQLQKLIEVENNRATLGIAYDALGRCLLSEGKYKPAEECFQSALEYHPIENSLAISRSMSNLGAVLIQLNDITRAREVLTQAANIQSTLNDMVGLIVTEKNLTLLSDK